MLEVILWIIAWAVTGFVLATIFIIIDAKIDSSPPLVNPGRDGISYLFMMLTLWPIASLIAISSIVSSSKISYVGWLYNKFRKEGR